MIDWPKELPTLEVEQLVLRPWQEVDADFVFESCQDPDIVEFTTIPAPYTRFNADEFIRSRSELFENKEVIPYAGVVNGKLAMSVSLHDINYFDHTCEVGYWINKEFRGLGLTTKAVKLITSYGFSLGFRRIQGLVLPENIGSQKVLLGAGFELEASLVNRLTKRDGTQSTGLVFSKIK